MTVQILNTTSDWLIVTADFPNLSVESLYQHWTTPDLLKKWWSPDVPQMTATVGETYHLAWSAMNWNLRGTVKAATLNTVFAFSWAWDHQPTLPTREVCISFTAKNNGSALTLLHGIYGDSHDDQNDRQSHIEGWTHFLGELGKISA